LPVSGVVRPGLAEGHRPVDTGITKGEGHVIIPERSMAMGALAGSLNGSAPRCEHLDGLSPIMPRSDYCPDCRARGGRWKALWVCLTCGWVACSNDSPNRHARAHYEETDHPLAQRLEPGSRWTWCYVHQRLV
jgi:Zn-finger in ubiquitin-hydrolases and other protein